MLDRLEHNMNAFWLLLCLFSCYFSFCSSFLPKHHLPHLNFSHFYCLWIFCFFSSFYRPYHLHYPVDFSSEDAWPAQRTNTLEFRLSLEVFTKEFHSLHTLSILFWSSLGASPNFCWNYCWCILLHADPDVSTLLLPTLSYYFFHEYHPNWWLQGPVFTKQCSPKQWPRSILWCHRERRWKTRRKGSLG